MNDHDHNAAELSIERAENARELAACLNIREQVFTGEKGVPRDIERDACDRLNGPCDHFAVRWGGESAGALRCLRLDPAAVKLQRFCFLKEYRDLGLGRKVLQFIEGYYQSRGFTRIVMDAKFDVAGVYEKCGYTKTSDPFTEAGVVHVAMAKNLRGGR